MILKAHDISKRFNYEWIFRNVQHTFTADTATAVIGPNGSGKSTLLRILAGQLTPTSGQLTYTIQENIPIETVYRHVNYAAPYLDVLEDLTLDEMFRFHAGFKAWADPAGHDGVVERSGLKDHRHKQIRQFSSGMRQRVKLVLAVCSVSELLILDEPTTNLDVKGVDWYLNLIRDYQQHRIIIIGSNQEKEYGFCQHVLNIQDFKPDTSLRA